MLSRCQLSRCFGLNATFSFTTPSHKDLLFKNQLKKRSSGHTRCQVRLQATQSRYQSTTRPPQREANAELSQKPDKPAFGSIFSSASSPRDHVFANLDEGRPYDMSSSLGRPHRTHTRRQTMTASEFKSMEEMLTTVFETAERREHDIESTSNNSPSQLHGEKKILETLSRFRRATKRTPEADRLFDQKKESMDRCNTDQELLEWATVNVFEEFQRHQESIEDAKSPHLVAYQQMIPILIRTFRDRYREPNLALFIFKYTQKSSIASYVCGCSTEAYNEALETLWSCFHDMQGVKDMLEEMSVNGVLPSIRTTRIVENLFTEASKQRLWLDQSEEGDKLAWETLTQISNIHMEMLARNPTTNKTKKQKWDKWKTQANTEESDDDWGFDDWGDSESSKRPLKTFGLKG